MSLILPAPFEWIEIPAGRVTLEKGGYLPQDTAFDVELFAIAKYPVTNAQYAVFLDAGGHDNRDYWTEVGWAIREKEGLTEPRFWGQERWMGDDHPVVGVSWYEALAYCRWLSEKAGEVITLPTEQQWQRAAQGDDGREYPWGIQPPSEQLCNWKRNIDRTTPVQQYPKGASPFGVMDMSGNVWEWCLTEYDVGTSDPGSTGARVLRGGSWLKHFSVYLRAANRGGLPPGFRGTTFGFRCVRLS